MNKGIKAKDIRDFEKYAAKLNEVIKRIQEYKPEAHIYATPGELNLMAGISEDNSARDEGDKMRVISVAVSKLEAGDW